MADDDYTTKWNAALLYIAQDLRRYNDAALLAVENMDYAPGPETMDAAFVKLLTLTRSLIATGRYDNTELNKMITDAKKNRKDGVIQGGACSIELIDYLDDMLITLEILIGEQSLFDTPQTTKKEVTEV